MKQKVLDYLVDKLLCDLRSHKQLAPELADQLALHSVALPLRSKLIESDSAWLREMLNSEFEGIVHFALCIVRPLQGDQSIRTRLFELWDKPDISPRIKYSLIFAILNYPNLDKKFHEKVYNWIKQYRLQCTEKDLEWYGGADRSFEQIKICLKKTHVIESKKWIYLMEVTGLGDNKRSLKIIEPYTEHSDSFISRVAKDLITQLEED
jgi:hypothetical protein